LSGNFAVNEWLHNVRLPPFIAVRRRRSRRSWPTWIGGFHHDLPIDANDADMKAGTIPGGRCAVLRVTHDTHNLEPAATYLYREWLPASGEEARDFPIYCRRWLTFFPGAEVHDVGVELHLPLK
jgi:predicted transcriptional regulator YdeE